MAAAVASSSSVKEHAGGPQLPRAVSALRSSRSGPKRVPTHVSIVVPKRATRREASPGPSPLPSDSTNTTPSSAPDLTVTSTPWAKKLILTLDGGGIRGYSSLIILRALMNEIADIEQTLEARAASSAHTDRIPESQIPDHVYRRGQYLPCHYFDYIAGTSMGGLIAIMLGMLGWTADQCIDEFHRQNKAIPLTNDRTSVNIDLPLLHRRSTWPTKRTRSFFDAFAKFSATSTAHTLPSQRESIAASLTLPAAASSSALSNTSSTASTAEFKKDTFQCQTLAWCTEVEDRPHHRSRRIPYAFCSYKEEDEDEEAETASQPIPEPTHTPYHAQIHHNIHHNNTTSTNASNASLISISEVAKAITNPYSSSFKPFKLGGGQFVDGSKQIKDPTLEVLKEISSLLAPSDDDSDSDDDDDDDDENISPTTTTKPPPKQHKKQHKKLPSNPQIDLVLSLGTDEHHAWFYSKLRGPVIAQTHTSWQSKISSESGRSYRDYHRFEVRDIKLGLRKKYFLTQIEEATRAYLEEGGGGVRQDIRRYAEFLVKRRRERAGTSRWETFALGVKYFCRHRHRGEGEGKAGAGGSSGKWKGCNSVRGEEGFESRGEYFDHLERRHDLLKMVAREGVDVEVELDRGRVFGCS